ncbi:MAG: gamma-glutamyl-gamma-aminobutyrate hydrolase family protein [Lachnospiraceae bacterium]|nr:gamma-glutamyl-gamma-aminobutyrate hydrolase family protein [Lachnospiraceae bacterium]
MIGNYESAVSGAGLIPVVADSMELLEECKKNQDSICSCTLTRMDLLLLPGGGDISPDLFSQPNFGSRNIDRELDLLQFAYLEYFLQRKKPVLGICKGMQLLNLRFGGTILQDMPAKKQNIHAYIKNQDNQHGCTYVPLEKMEPFPRMPLLKKLYGIGSLPSQINSAHHQEVEVLAPELIPFQYAPDSVIEGFVHRTLPIIGLQWHPERLFYSEGTRLKIFLNALLSEQ